MTKRQLDWVNTFTIGTCHALAVVAIVWMAMNFSWWTAGLGLLWFAFCGLGITGGYHRLFSHPTYKAAWPLRLFYLLFGAASVQNSALKWSIDHRVHHSRVDTDDDPYDINKGFWWAHIGWIFFKSENEVIAATTAKDLVADPLIRFQDKWYIPLAVLMAIILPAAIGSLWGDALGAVLVCGFLRLVFQWHATFSVNSLAHMFGEQTFDTRNSARDHWFTAIVSLGEGFHNFHHRFQSDYRNGIRWFDFDPTKWFVWTMSKIGITRDLKRVPTAAIERAREAAMKEAQAA
jgi:stearoyl-CoA desaturase (Delta-9 desaturase)